MANSKLLDVISRCYVASLCSEFYFHQTTIIRFPLLKLDDKTLFFSNGSKTEFSFTIGRLGKILAVFTYARDTIFINNNWKVGLDGVHNRCIDRNPDLIKSKILHIEIAFDGIGRVDVKIGGSANAAAIFTEKDLLFVRMNGHHVFPRINELVEQQAQKIQRDMNQPLLIQAEDVLRYINDHPEFKNSLQKEFGKKYFEKWTQDHEWGLL